MDLTGKGLLTDIQGIRTDCSPFGAAKGYFLDKAPCYCPYNDSVAVRLGTQEVKVALKEEPGVTLLEHGGFVRREWVSLSPELIATDEQLRRWVNQAVEYVRLRAHKKAAKRQNKR